MIEFVIMNNEKIQSEFNTQPIPIAKSKEHLRLSLQSTRTNLWCWTPKYHWIRWHIYKTNLVNWVNVKQWFEIFQLNCLTSEKSFIIFAKSVFICWRFFVLLDRFCWLNSFKWCKSFEISSIIAINKRTDPMA